MRLVGTHKKHGKCLLLRYLRRMASCVCMWAVVHLFHTHGPMHVERDAKRLKILTKKNRKHFLEKFQKNFKPKGLSSLVFSKILGKFFEIFLVRLL